MRYMPIACHKWITELSLAEVGRAMRLLPANKLLGVVVYRI